MKIATTTGDFSLYCPTDKERISNLYQAGFRYIDLSLYSLNSNSNYMQDDWRDAVKKLKLDTEKLGAKFVQAHSQGGNPLDSNQEHVDFLVDATLRSIEICQELGIKNTVVHPGFKAGITKEEWFEKNRDFYKKLLPLAETCGINILIENSCKSNMGENYFANSSKDMVDFIRFVDHPMLHICWDTGHANCEGSQYDEIITIGDELYAIHYNDNDGLRDEHLIPYLGTLNHDEIINALIDINYTGYFTLECCSSLIPRKYWLGDRRSFNSDSRLSEPPLFMQQKLEELLYQTAKYLLSSYSLFDE